MYLLSEYEQMNEKQETYMERYTQLAEQIETLKKMARALSLPWEGEANRQYLVRLETDLIEIVCILDRLYKAGELLHEAIVKYQKTEGVIAELIAEL